MPPAHHAALSKLPAITLAFWIMKIAATTLGETLGDYLSNGPEHGGIDLGYGLASLIVLGIFLATLLPQLAVKRFIPFLYWAVILSTSTAGTTMSDFMDRTVGLGYAKPFDKNSLFHLLTNPAYVGKVRHKTETYDGEHKAIVDVDIWRRVQQLLTRNGRTGGAEVRNRYPKQSLVLWGVNALAKGAPPCSAARTCARRVMCICSLVE